jgi:hypothetical protein
LAAKPTSHTSTRPQGVNSEQGLTANSDMAIASSLLHMLNNPRDCWVETVLLLWKGRSQAYSQASRHVLGIASSIV